MISVLQIIQDACEDVGIVEAGESVGGDMFTRALKQLNRAARTLSAQEYLASRIEFRDATASGELTIGQNGTIADVDAPTKLYGVSRKVGDRFLPLRPADSQVLFTGTHGGLPTSYTYSLNYDAKGKPIGIVTLDGKGACTIRVFWTNELPEYSSVDNIYLPSIVEDILEKQLCVNLCEQEKLYSYSDRFEQKLSAAKALYKRGAYNAKAFRDGCSMGSYNDNYSNGLGGVGF